jgi:hypothetical protein
LILEGSEHAAVQIDVGETLLHESLSQLANSVVVGDAPTLSEHFVSSFNFYFFVDVAYFLDGKVLIFDTKVDVDSSTCFVELSHSEANPHALDCLISILYACIVDSLLDVLAKWSNL